MRKSILAAISLAATLLLPACSSLSTGGIRIGDSAAGRIAKDAAIPGKGVPGKCLVFANALQGKLEAAGIASRVIVYGYEATPVPGSLAPIGSGPGNCGAHAVVAYEDGGRTYIMDNQSWSPRWVRGGTPEEMVQRFSGIDVDVKMARVTRDSGLDLAPSEVGPKMEIAGR